MIHARTLASARAHLAWRRWSLVASTAALRRRLDALEAWLAG